MAETINIGEMAEKISDEIFKEFLWEMLPSTNMNWKCVTKAHNKKTHPSDVVYTYKEPYKNIRTYINTDLKSYAKGTINKTNILTAIESLAKSISCADISTEWQKLYKYHEENFQIYGLLFIFNHDDEFDKDFKEMMHKAMKKHSTFDNDKRIFILGPADICYLKTIVNDIKVLRGDSKISSCDKCNFYYPDLINSRLNWSDEQRASTLEMLTSPYQILEYEIPDKVGTKGIKFYYRRTGETIEEFIYLFDYLLHYQILENNSIEEIEFRMPNPSKFTPSLFEAAKVEYASRFSDDENFSKRLSKVKYTTINSIITKYNEVEIGMRNE